MSQKLSIFPTVCCTDWFRLCNIRSGTKQKTTSFRQAKEDFERRKKIAEKRQKEDDRKRKFQEKQVAVETYKSKKAERYKVLSKKTSKGQPMMAGRIEMLLDKIKASE